MDLIFESDKFMKGTVNGIECNIRFDNIGSTMPHIQIKWEDLLTLKNFMQLFRKNKKFIKQKIK